MLVKEGMQSGTTRPVFSGYEITVRDRRPQAHSQAREIHGLKERATEVWGKVLSIWSSVLRKGVWERILSEGGYEGAYTSSVGQISAQC